ncbi:hypothetical protein [Halomarina ordinaria]|uniref:DUF35 domain-containing protein n=1 Tax=Halomarina ordinaria TaxID=3033939 RepID=A0ABD5U9U7_9EURY|nr:hypothetical protein [Halomarina sp. PSRA2]
MGLFKRLGRQVEQFKQTATETAEGDADYRCRACDARYHVQHDRCPECGTEDVVATAPGE